jgi:hypothetical protein
MEQQPTYQELLAEIYEENAANTYVFDRFYEDEELDTYNVNKYDSQKIENEEEFNKVQGDYNKPENVVQPPPSTNEQGKSSYGYNKDIRTTVVNIDGRFRETTGVAPPRLSREECAAQAAIQGNFGESSGTQFAIMLGRQYKNVISVKVISLEFENSFYTFSALNPSTGFGRENTSLLITVGDNLQPLIIIIPDGNYTVTELITEVQTAVIAAVKVGDSSTTPPIVPIPDFTFTITQDPRTRRLTLRSNYIFAIQFPQNVSSFTKNGLGYNLGFYDLFNESVFDGSTVPPTFKMPANTRPDVKQDQYVYLQINDWHQVQHQYPDQTKLSAFLKVPITVPKFEVQFDNIQLDTVSKEYFFSQPSNIQKLVISVVDTYGTILDMKGGSFSMSLAIDEVLQSNIYEKLLQI